MTSRTGSTRSAIGMRAIAAIWPSVNWRAREAATVTTARPRGWCATAVAGCRPRAGVAHGSPPGPPGRRPRGPGSPREAGEKIDNEEGVALHAARSAGGHLPPVPPGRPPPPPRPRGTQRRQADRRGSGDGQLGQRPADLRRSWSGRTAISHATGNDASHWVSMRKAKPYPRPPTARHPGIPAAAAGARRVPSGSAHPGEARTAPRGSDRAIRAQSVDQ